MSVALDKFAQTVSLMAVAEDKTSQNPQSFKRVWCLTQEKMKEMGKWLITEAVSSDARYKELFDEYTKKSSPPFKAICVANGFPGEPEPKVVDVLMTNSDMTVRQFREEIGRINKLDPNQITIVYRKILNDEDNILLDLHCHGLGGERFEVFFEASKK